jgi:hypothetical protein
MSHRPSPAVLPARHCPNLTVNRPRRHDKARVSLDEEIDVVGCHCLESVQRAVSARR